MTPWPLILGEAFSLDTRAILAKQCRFLNLLLFDPSDPWNSKNFSLHGVPENQLLCNTPVTPTGDQPATAVRSWTLNIFTKRSEIAEKKMKSMTPCSFIVAHSTLLTRSHCDHLRFRCDSNTLSTHSLRSQCVYNMRTALPLRFLRPHQSTFFFWYSCLCAITKINCSHTCLYVHDGAPAACSKI